MDARTPHFEPLEPRLLLNADLIEPVPLSLAEAPLSGDAICVDLSQQDDGTQGQQAVELFSTSPALFVENQGQWSDPSVRYVHDGDSVDVAVTDSGVWFQATRQDPSQGEGSTGPAGSEQDPLHTRDTEVQVLQFSASFVGADLVPPTGLEPSGSLFNYCVGDQANWREDVPSYEIVAYEGLYEGVDLYIQGLRSRLKYEFHVAPGADYGQMVIQYEGIQGLSITEDGSLAVDLGTGWGVIQDDAPYIYQEIDGQKVEVAGRFVLLDDRTYSFEVTGAVDPDRVLVIDPDLAWSTYLCGSENDDGRCIAVDTSGGVYVTGDTPSYGWTSGGFDTTYNGGYDDAFVAKLSPSGAHLWSTYLGGSSVEGSNGIAADASSAVYVTGFTQSPDWTSGGFDTTYNGGPDDAFVAKLSSGGAHLWSTYLGGSSTDAGAGIAMDASSDVYVTGGTRSSDWTSGGFDTSYNGGDFGDAFVAKLSSTGAHLWSTYVGGTGSDGSGGIAVDTSGGVYTAGWTDSSGWTSGGFDTSYNDDGLFGDAFVVKLSSGGAHLWSTYLGGTNGDGGYNIAVDAWDGVYVTGETSSYDWTSGGFDTSFNGVGDAFVAKLGSTGAHFWSTYLGGGDEDSGYDIAGDASGGVYVTGRTASSDWTSGGFDTTYNGGFADAFVAKIMDQMGPDTTAPSPNPSTWAAEPYATGPTSIRMAATAASDSSGVEYYFDETSGNPGGTDSGWQDSNWYEDTGLLASTAYTYQVKTRDKSMNHNETSYSGSSSATTQAPAIITNVSSVSIPEGSTWTFEVTLSAPPGSDLTVTVSRAEGDSDITVSAGSSLIFTSSNWDTCQTVTLSAAEDTDTRDSTATIRCSASGLSDKDVTAMELDNDTSLAPVYRFWSPVHSGHFYTIDVTERDKLINNYPRVWTYEGVAYYAFTDDSEPGVARIYRFWSGTLNAHFYTMSQTERDKLINDYPHVWTYEGVAFYAYAAGSQPDGTKAVYRFWSGTLNSHFYTMAEDERDKLINDYPHVWTYEIIAWYAFGV